MTRLVAVLLAILMVLSPVTATAAVAVHGSTAPSAGSVSGSSPPPASDGSGGSGATTRAAAGELSPGLVTETIASTETTNDTAPQSDSVTTAGRQQSTSGQSPYTATVVPAQPEIKWGGRAVAVDVHPQDSNRAIVASESGGLFETTDGGSTWTHLDGAYPHRLEDVEYADSNPRVIVLAAERDSRKLRIGGRVVSGGGIWVSRDGGQTWTKPASAEPPASSNCDRAGNVTAKSVAFEPGTTNVYVGTNCGLAVSTDLGRTWSYEKVDGQKRRVGTVIAPAQDKVDVCTRYDGHFRYRPSSDTWQVPQEKLPDRSCEWNGPHSLAASPSDSDVLFAVVRVGQDKYTDDSSGTCNKKRELFESDDGGQTWTDLNAPGCGLKREPFVAAPPTTSFDGSFPVFVGKGANIHRQMCSVGSGSLRCSDSPGDWDQQVGNKVSVDHADPTDIAFPSNSYCPNFLTNDGGVEKTNDCGKSFSNVGNSSSAGGFNALQLYTINGRIFSQPDHTDLYFGTQDNRIWAGSRRGQRWDKGPGNELGFMGLNRTAVTHGGEPVMIEAAKTSNHFLASDRRLARTGLWPNPPGVGAGNLAGSKAYYVDKGVYLQWNGSSNGRTLWRTTNTGQAGSWTPLATLKGAAIRDTPIVGPASDPTMYVPQGSDVKRITNLRGGSTATVGSVGTGLTTAIHIRGEGTFDFNAVFEAIPDGSDPDDRATLIAADASDDVMKISRDGGRTWQASSELTRLVTGKGAVRMNPPGRTSSQASEIDADPGNDSRIFVGTEANGIVASFDGGRTWGRVPDTRKIPAVSDFFFDNHTGGDGFRDVYVASYGRGLWKIDDVNKLKPLPKPDGYDGPGENNDDPSSVTLNHFWQHTAHLRCPDETTALNGRSPGDDCSAMFTNPNVYPKDLDRGAPLAAKETWRILLVPKTLDGDGDEDFYRIPDVPDPTTHRNISTLPNPECGRQSVTVGGTSKVVETTGRLSVIVTPKGNSLSRTPVRTADGATPINIYNTNGQQLDIGTTISDGNKLIHRIQCPHKNGYSNLVVSFGEGTAANSGGYEIEFRYRIDLGRPNDIADVTRQVARARRIAEDAGKYERIGEKFRCQPNIRRGNRCVYKTRHPIGDSGGEGGIPGGFCEEAICRQRWELRRVEERPFEMSVLGNENLQIELQKADPTSDGDEDPDGETVARSEPGECIPREEFGQLLSERGRGATVREVGTDRLVSQMGQSCSGTTFGRQATETVPDGVAPVRHRLAVESLEPGLYQLVITGPQSAYWLESFTPSVAELEEDDAASQPRAGFELTPEEPVTEEPVTVNATGTTDPDGSVVRYEWRFGPEGEGRTVTTRAATATHTFREPGEYTVTLTVTDDDGNTDTLTREVAVRPAPAGETGVRLEPARQTIGDCSIVDDNRIPSEASPEESERTEEGNETTAPSEEGFEEEVLPCTVYDPVTPRVGADGKIRYDVVVDDANTGIGAGGFAVALSNGEAANITAVSLGPNVETGRQADVDLPADEVEVTAAELIERLGDARGQTVLATITVAAEDGGSGTDLQLSSTSLRNPRGDAYTVTTETGSTLAISNSTERASAEPEASVRFVPASQTVAVGRTTSVDIRLTNVTGGVGSYELVVNTSDAAFARLVSVENRIGGTGQIDRAADGSSVRIGAFAGDTSDTGPVPLATVRVEGVAPGEAGLSVAVESVSDETGTQYDLATTTDLATVSVREEPQAPEVVAGQPATDPDGDSVYEDVNGDGEVNPGDATVLFNAVFEGNEAVTNNPERFDLNGDGEVNPGDATVLFEEAFGS